MSLLARPSLVSSWRSRFESLRSSGALMTTSSFVATASFDDRGVLEIQEVADAAESGVRATGDSQATQALGLVVIDGALRGTRDAHYTVSHGVHEARRVVEKAAELRHLATRGGAPIQLHEQARRIEMVGRQPGEVGGDLELAGEVARRGVVECGQADQSPAGAQRQREQRGAVTLPPAPAWPCVSGRRPRATRPAAAGSRLTPASAPARSRGRAACPPTCCRTGRAATARRR